MPSTIAEQVSHNIAIGRGWSPDGQLRPFTALEFFQISDELGLNQRNPDYRRLFENLAVWIQHQLKVESVLEIGSGPGYLLFLLNALGMDAIGVDGNEYSKAMFDIVHREYQERYRVDPTFELDYAPADLVVAIECFEHIPEEGLERLMTKVAATIRPRYIVFSSTPHADPHPGWDVQWGHINVKTEGEWLALFQRYGFRLGAPRPPVTEWALLLVNENT